MFPCPTCLDPTEYPDLYWPPPPLFFLFFPKVSCRGLHKASDIPVLELSVGGGGSARAVSPPPTGELLFPTPIIFAPNLNVIVPQNYHQASSRQFCKLVGTNSCLMLLVTLIFSCCIKIFSRHVKRVHKSPKNSLFLRKRCL